MQIKAQLGKLHLRLPLAEIIRDQQQHNGLVLEPVTFDDILGLEQLPPYHRDPFDRLLVSQSNRSGFQLVSQDPEIARYVVPLLW